MIEKELFLPTDNCRFSCYFKKNRVFCRRVDKYCHPAPLMETAGHKKTREAYVASLPQLLRIAYDILRTQVKANKKDYEALLRFYNYVRPKAYVYGSPRPAPLGVPNVKVLIPIETITEGWDYWDIIVTDRKLKPNTLDEYELTPLTLAAQHFFKISNLSRFDILSKVEMKQYQEWYKEMQFSYKEALQDFMVMGKEYFNKRYKTKGTYPMTYAIAGDLLNQLGIVEE